MDFLAPATMTIDLQRDIGNFVVPKDVERVQVMNGDTEVFVLNTDRTKERDWHPMAFRRRYMPKAYLLTNGERFMVCTNYKLVIDTKYAHWSI